MGKVKGLLPEYCERCEELDVIKAELVEALELIKEARSIFTNCEVQSCTCCCGAEMSAHDPMSSDHTPRDSGEYAVSKWTERALEVLDIIAPHKDQT